jgi:thiol:disulfide interchange protein
MNRRSALAWIACAVAAKALGAQPLPEMFDPKRDPAADLAVALEMAKAGGKRVIVDVGGEWCSWCHILDRFFADNAEIDALRRSRYVWLKVNWSRENENRAFLARWPKVAGYPHLFVLDADGKLVHSQDTGVLERGKGYDEAKMRAFLTRYAA